MTSEEDAERVRLMRIERAKRELDEEINRCSAPTESKAFLRQRLAHLWELVSSKLERGRR